MQRQSSLSNKFFVTFTTLDRLMMFCVMALKLYLWSENQVTLLTVSFYLASITAVLALGAISNCISPIFQVITSLWWSNESAPLKVFPRVLHLSCWWCRWKWDLRKLSVVYTAAHSEHENFTQLSLVLIGALTEFVLDSEYEDMSSSGW